MTLEEDNSELQAAIAALREQNRLLEERDRLRQALQVQLQRLSELLQRRVTQLEARVQELEGRLAKDSHNSSKPPSSDGWARPARPPRSLRHRSGKKPGGQIGHRGQTLSLVACPDAVEVHRPTTCAHCQAPLAADLPVEGVDRRQVVDVPPLRLEVCEHQALRVRCPVCLALTTGAFPAAAPSRTQYGPRLRALAVYLSAQQLVPYARVREALADLFGVAVSLGSVLDWVAQGATTLEPVEAALKAALRQAPVLHSDETGIRQGGKGVWAHVTCTARLTHYAIHPKRGREALDAIGILPDYTGVDVHDGWKPYRWYTRCRHALCNVHHLRELTFLEEEAQQPWAGALKTLLLRMKAACEQARGRGLAHVPRSERDALVARYQALLATGLAANPPPNPLPGRHRGRRKQSPARNLLERFLLQQDQVLAFLDDLTIPFDNNQAERDLRMLKAQQKVSGGFRAPSGATAFARIRGYLSTLRKQGVDLLTALETVFAGSPLYPSFA